MGFWAWENKFPQTRVFCNSINAQFYNENRLSLIQEKESPTRVIISNNAMGMDFKSISKIILFGPPNSIFDVL